MKNNKLKSKCCNADVEIGGIGDFNDSEPKLNEEKTKNIILYFLNKLGGMSEKKLQMLLYFASYDYFEKEEEHLTGLVFYKTKNGIFIKKLNEILIKMIKQKEIKLI